MNELISIIIPVYNTAAYLNRCLDSVLAQTYHNIEIILINDGSTDGSAEICEQYVLKDKRIVLIHTENRGVSSARNTGIDTAKGIYLTFIDSDDYVDNNLVEILYQSRLESSADLIVSALKDTSEQAPFSIKINNENIDEIKFLLNNYLIFGPTQKLYCSEIIKLNSVRFPSDFMYGEDLLFNISYLEKITDITYVDRVMYHYENGDNMYSLSRRKRWDMFQNDMYVNNAIKVWLENSDLMNKDTELFISNRIVDTVCNSVCLPFEKESPWKLNERFKYYQTIVKDELTDWALKTADTGLYPDWMIFMIRNRCSFLLLVISILKRGLL